LVVGGVAVVADVVFGMVVGEVTLAPVARVRRALPADDAER